MNKTGSLRWTTEPPSEPGEYWRETGDGRRHIRRVYPLDVHRYRSMGAGMPGRWCLIPEPCEPASPEEAR